MNVHSIFYIILSKLYHENTIPNQVQPSLLLITIGKETEYEVKEVLDSMIS